MEHSKKKKAKKTIMPNLSEKGTVELILSNIASWFIH